MPSLSQQIADLEEEIDLLLESAKQSRKVDAVSKAAMSAGGLLLLALVSGVIQSDPVWIVVAISAVLGSVVLFGSNKSTQDEIATRIKRHEAQRIAFIDEMELRTVND
jgi:hypothetical protein